MNRFPEIDFFRGIAILMMMVFHFLWDLKYFSLIDIQLYEGFWGLFQKATAGLFLFLVGVSLTLSYNKDKGTYVKTFLLRGTMIFGFGLLVTIATWIFFPQSFIYFGILHLIGVAILLSIPLIRKTRLNLVLAIILLSLGIFVNTFSAQIPFLVWLGLDYPTATLDFFPVIPWFSAVLFGLAAGNYLYRNGERHFSFEWKESAFKNFVVFLGKHALTIYLVHQAILFPIVYVLSQF